MEQLLKLGSRLYSKAGILIAVIVLLAAGFIYITGLSPNHSNSLSEVLDVISIMAFIAMIMPMIPRTFGMIPGTLRTLPVRRRPKTSTKKKTTMAPE